MNIVILCGGAGARFQEAGYNLPKPLIALEGKPLFGHVVGGLSLSPEHDRLVIPYLSEFDRYGFRDIVLRYVPPGVPVVFLPLEKLTAGAAETALLTVPFLAKEQAVAFFDCDTFYRGDVLARLRHVPEEGALFYFRQEETVPIYSYLETDAAGRVTSLVEKVRVSDKANSGCYFWASAARAETDLRAFLCNGERNGSEAYLSGAVNVLLRAGASVAALPLPVEQVVCVGTPAHLIYHGSRPTRVLRFCFDLDATLVTAPQVRGDYTTCQPIKRNIDFLRRMKDAGHYVIVHTARRMLTHNHDAAAAEKDIGPLTRSQLSTFGIEYDQLLFGKPYADFYIDDKAVPADARLDFACGVYSCDEDARAHHAIKEVRVAEVPEPCLEKCGAVEAEKAWYASLPPTLKALAPKVHASSPDKLVMSRVRGVPMSRLYISGLLREKQVEGLRDTLSTLHLHKPADAASYNGGALCAELWPEKLRSRYKEHEAFYAQAFKGAGFTMPDELLDAQRYFTVEDPVFMHGDPVFSNVLLTLDGGLKLIDPRGRIGADMTSCGLAEYDTAKVAQALLGYDYCVAGQDIDVARVRRFVKALLIPSGGLSLRVRCLIVSMLPLHKDRPDRVRRYLTDLYPLCDLLD
jgi:dTDP-glucose pyrophosphorylase